MILMFYSITIQAAENDLLRNSDRLVVCFLFALFEGFNVVSFLLF